jgi:hypothetical protein
MSAHMQYVTRLLCRAEKLRFFMDQESGADSTYVGQCFHRMTGQESMACRAG